ncbi:TPA: hypothetical protein ACX6QC_003756 [Photobacterium damselae]
MINLSKIKKVYTSIPSKYLFPLKFIPFEFFCGEGYREQLKKIKTYLSLTIEEQKKIENELLINYLNDSIKYTKFYKDFAKQKRIIKITSPEQILDFPILHKEQVNEDLSWFLDKRFEKSRFLVTTGGTTGKQTRLYMSNKAYSIEWAFVSNYLKSQGIDINSKRLSLRGTNGIKPNELLEYNYLYKELMLSPFRLNKLSDVGNIKKIQDFNPEWIHGYPSSVSEFANYLDTKNINISSIKNVFLVSEKLYIEQENKIKKAFNCDISTFYGMTERVIFAEKHHGIFKPNKLYGLTECIDGELIGTGFINQATRLIRYKTGDSADVKLSHDGFVDTITEVTGRWGKESLIGKNGIKITMTSLNIHSDALDNVIKYQFVQKQKGICELLIQPSDLFKIGDELKISNEFQQKVGDELRILPKIVSSIDVTSRGKHRFIISYL